MPLQRNEGGQFPATRDVPAGLGVFSLGRTVVIIDNAGSEKFRFPAEMTYPEDADSRDGARQ
jgi:hypothetical protein